MLRHTMDRLPRFGISFSSSKSSMISTTTTARTQVPKLARQANIQDQPPIRYHQVQQQDQDESTSFSCRSKKAVSWASTTVDNESTPKKSFNKEYYFSRVFELNREVYVGVTPGSMQMRLVKRI